MANDETSERSHFPAFSMSDTRKTLRWRIISSAVLMSLSLGALFAHIWGIGALGLALGIVMAIEWERATRDHSVLIRGAGLAWIAAAGTALIALRMEPGGAGIILWLFAIAWAGDTGAYIVGKILGRRALPAWISSDKTWEGLAGGALAGALAGTAVRCFAAPFGFAPAELVLASAALALAGQLGDCLESAAKRRLGVKDMSGLIPGHGGVLDRLDSMLAILIATGGALAVSRWPG